jgi:predicted regulator of Ras-like GTPase activity (Roadblock/LC7/MglB family)
MNQEIYSVALKGALTEIKNVCPDIKWSFILMNNGVVIAGDEQATGPTLEKAAGAFQTLAEKSVAVGGLDNILIDAENGKVYVSCINSMYLVAGLNKHADLPYFRNITQVILPTILKVLDNIASPSITPTPLKQAPYTLHIPSKPVSSEQITKDSEQITKEIEVKEEFEQPERSEPIEATDAETSKNLGTLPCKQLIVERFGGLLLRSDSVQIDDEILKQWSELLEVEEINEVEIETFNGQTARCKTKVINDPKLQGRGLIRMPEKTCQALDIEKGELVRVKPVVPED